MEPLAGHQDQEHGSQLQRCNGIGARKRACRHTATVLIWPSSSTGENQTKPCAMYDGEMLPVPSAGASRDRPAVTRARP